MMPEQWPIATSEVERSTPARAAGPDRLSTVRVDFFLNPADRLTEQERALMTAMLGCLVSDIAAEICVALPPGWVGANDDEAAIVEELTRAGLLDETELMALLLRRADEERIATAARSRIGRRDARALQALVSHDNGSVAAAAMALILGRGRRRDRFGQCLVSVHDLSREAAGRLVQAIAASLRSDVAPAHGTAAADGELVAAAARLMATHDPSRSIDALTSVVVEVLDRAGCLSDELLLACAQEGEVGFIAEVVGRRAGIPAKVAFEELLSGKADRLMPLLRVGGISRDVCAGLLASIGDLLGIADPGAAIGIFDAMAPDQVQAAAMWLTADPAYRAALRALEDRNG